MARHLKDYKYVGTMLSEWIFGNLPFVFFLFFVGLIYIANSNYSQKQVRRMQTLQNELKDMKWRYNAAKADLMLNTKQSEVERAVDPFGLRASNQRTKRIIMEKK
jgi:Bacteriodetes cell division protein (FtsL-like)